MMKHTANTFTLDWDEPPFGKKLNGEDSVLEPGDRCKGLRIELKWSKSSYILGLIAFVLYGSLHPVQ